MVVSTSSFSHGTAGTGKRGERPGSVGALLVLQARRQVLFELGDLVGLRIVLSLGPLDHLLDAFPGVPIVIDTDPAV